MSKLKQCKSCSKDVSKSAKECPHCGQRLKMRFFTKILIVVGGIVVIGAMINGDENETATISPVASSSITPPVASPDKEAPLSKEGVSSEVQIKVESFETATSLGDNQFSKATAQGIFKIVKLTITNNQKDAITLDSNSFKLFDSQKREFGSSSDGQMAIETSSSKKESFFLKQLNPGLTMTGYVVYDVPKDANGFVLQARGGMTGDAINLRVE